MFKPHNAVCTECSNFTLVVVKKGLCAKCNYELKQSKKKAEGKDTKKKTYVKKKTGEIELFHDIYEERNGTCEITGHSIPFNVSSFAHVLGKKAYPKFRLYKPNIMLVEERIHILYDNCSKDKLLAEYPAADVIFEKKELLKQLYYQTNTNL
jgi:hypothetical protein